MANRPSIAGAKLGRKLSQMADESFALFPDALGRCRTCAFRLGTYPNRCWQTVVDAFGCLDINDPFHCHERFDAAGHPDLCAGYEIVSAAKARKAA